MRAPKRAAQRAVGLKSTTALLGRPSNGGSLAERPSPSAKRAAFDAGLVNGAVNDSDDPDIENSESKEEGKEVAKDRAKALVGFGLPPVGDYDDDDEDDDDDENEDDDEGEEEDGDDYDDSEDLLETAKGLGDKMGASGNDDDADEDGDDDDDEAEEEEEEGGHGDDGTDEDDDTKQVDTDRSRSNQFAASRSAAEPARASSKEQPARSARKVVWAPPKQAAPPKTPWTASQKKAIEKEASELSSLLENLKDGLADVRQRMSKVSREVDEGLLDTSDGVSYLEAKHVLLLQYCSHLVYFVLLKAEGASVEGHPVIERLVEQRAYLEKIRPIDKMLAHQVDRLLKAAQKSVGSAEGEGAMAKDTSAPDADNGGGDDDDDDALRYGPRPDRLMAKTGGMVTAEEAGAPAVDLGTGLGSGTGVYRPPKINPVSMETGESLPDMTRNDRRKMQEARRKASHSTLLRDLAAEVAGAPLEQRLEVAGQDTLAAQRTRQRLDARAAAEEDMMIRVPLSKDEMKKLKAQKRSGMSGAAMMDDFGSEVADIVKTSRSSDRARGRGYGGDGEDDDDDNHDRPTKMAFGGGGKKKGGGGKKKFSGKRKR